MPQNSSAGLLAFLLALPSLTVTAPPPGEASVAATAPDAPQESPTPSEASASPLPGAGPTAEASPAEASPAEAMEARLRRLSAEIRSRAGAVKADLPEGLREGEAWLMAGAWLNGNNRGWVNRGWPNRVQGGSYYRSPQMWANFRPSWNNFRNGPRFINW